MTAQEMIEILKKLNPKEKILMASDEEGNSVMSIADLCLSELSGDTKAYVIWPDDVVETGY